MQIREYGPRPARDGGSTIIEILIAIVLMSTIIAGTLTTLRATIISGTVHRDHSNAHAWLQSAADLLYSAPKVACDQTLPDHGEAAVRTAYEGVIDSVSNPEGWEDWQIRVVPTIEFWNAANIDADPDIEYFFASTCDPMRALQLIEIEVRSTDGRILESVEIVK